VTATGAVDVGGTRLRTALVTGRDVDLVADVRTVSRLTRPDCTANELVALLLDQVVEQCRPLVAHGCVEIGVSLGAAMDASTGVVLASAPLWGPARVHVAAAEELTQREPGVRWVVVNDLTAAALDVDDVTPPGPRRVAALTVSSGIALRTYDRDRGTPLFSPVTGLQGEIGHLPTRVAVHGRELRLACDCGDEGHVSAYCSGPGIAAVVGELRAALGDDAVPWATSTALLAAVRGGDRDATSLLDALTRPLADILLALATLDPDVGVVGLTGGVVEAAGEAYRASLLRHLTAAGLYGADPRDAGFLERFLVVVEAFACLRGAALAVSRAGSSR
jgi:predicted NBD/HSP70 family sugar kinase